MDKNADLPGCRVNKHCSLCRQVDSGQFARKPFKQHLFTGSDKLTDMQPGSWLTRAFSGVEKPFLFPDLAVKAVKTEK